MMIATLLCGVLLTVPPVACNPKAIGASERPRYAELTKRLRTAVRGKIALADGYAVKLDGAAIALREVAEWMELERRCCPFLRVQLAVNGGEAVWTLALTGPEGTKAVLEAEFSAR